MRCPGVTGGARPVARVVSVVSVVARVVSVVARVVSVVTGGGGGGTCGGSGGTCGAGPVSRVVSRSRVKKRIQK